MSAAEPDHPSNHEPEREISALVTDAWTGLDASQSLEEMLWLVAARARKLLRAQCCLATVARDGHPRTAEAISHPVTDPRWTKFARWLDLCGIYELVRRSGGAIIMTTEQLARVSVFRIATVDRPLRGWLAASLTGADGSDLGAIQLFDHHDASFTADDETALIDLAQMTSAGVERWLRYPKRRR